MTKTMDRPRMRVDDPARDTAWMADAACKGLDVNLWFPVSRPETGCEAEQAEAAKAVCGSCPARLACLAWADATAQQFGIFGGLTPNERRAARRAERAS